MAPLLSLTKLGLTTPVPLSRTLLSLAPCLKDLGGHLAVAQSNEGYLPAREQWPPEITTTRPIVSLTTCTRWAYDILRLGFAQSLAVTPVTLQMRGRLRDLALEPCRVGANHTRSWKKLENLDIIQRWRPPVNESCHFVNRCSMLICPCFTCSNITCLLFLHHAG
jgi:hypothetical protein